jgi:hypothetical protein
LRVSERPESLRQNVSKLKDERTPRRSRSAQSCVRRVMQTGMALDLRDRRKRRKSQRLSLLTQSWRGILKIRVSVMILVGMQ